MEKERAEGPKNDKNDGRRPSITWEYGRRPLPNTREYLYMGISCNVYLSTGEALHNLFVLEKMLE